MKVFAAAPLTFLPLTHRNHDSSLLHARLRPRAPSRARLPPVSQRDGVRLLRLSRLERARACRERRAANPRLRLARTPPTENIDASRRCVRDSRDEGNVRVFRRHDRAIARAGARGLLRHVVRPVPDALARRLAQSRGGRGQGQGEAGGGSRCHDFSLCCCSSSFPSFPSFPSSSASSVREPTTEKTTGQFPARLASKHHLTSTTRLLPPTQKINTEKYPNIASKYKVEALPTIMLFKEGKVADRIEGMPNAPQLIDRLLYFLQ